jgi:hypothetical protein
VPLSCWPETVLLHSVLSEAECRGIIDLLVSTKGFGAGRAIATGHEDLRKNEVLVWMAPPSFVDTLWTRIGPELQKRLNGGGRGLNCRMRVYRYERASEFLPCAFPPVVNCFPCWARTACRLVPRSMCAAPDAACVSASCCVRSHHDGGQLPSFLSADGCAVREDAAASRSRYSLLLYLNGAAAEADGKAEVSDGDTFGGGATALFTSSSPLAQPVRIIPQVGGGIVFPHGDHPSTLLHAGEAVTSGTKFVIRTDVF